MTTLRRSCFAEIRIWAKGARGRFKGAVECCQRPVLGAIRRQLREVVERDRNAERVKSANVTSCGFPPPTLIPEVADYIEPA
jgi:hypothetical protein